MKEDNYKQLLIESWEIQEGLMKFCTDALRALHKEDELSIALDEFREGVESYGHCGCIQPFSCIEERIKRWKETKIEQ